MTCPSSTEKCIRFAPIAFTDLGTYPLSIKLDDTNLNTVYSFNVEVYNEPPTFSTDPVSSVIVKLNSNYLYVLPPYSDPQGNPITVSINTLDPLISTFVTVATDQLSININPVDFNLYNL